MPQVDGRAIKARAGQLRTAGQKAVSRHMRAQIGRDHMVLMENPTLGRTEQFAQVTFAAPQTEGSIVPARITAVQGEILIGQAI